MNIITVPFVRDRRLMVECCFGSYVLQSVAGLPYAEKVVSLKREEDVERDERKVELAAEITDGRLDLFG